MLKELHEEVAGHGMKHICRHFIAEFSDKCIFECSTHRRYNIDKKKEEYDENCVSVINNLLYK